MTERTVFLSGCPGDTRRYRVLHLAEALELAGWEATVHAIEAPAARATARDVEGARALILHRVAWSRPVAALVKAARAASATVLFDADDLVFEPAFDARRAALRAALDGGARVGLDDPAARYARTLAACDGALATTGALAAAFEARGARTAVVRNAIDLTLLRLSTEAAARRAPQAGRRVVVGYASGTPSHDRDLAVAAPALRALLDARPDVVLRLIGPVGLDDAAWGPYLDRVERVPFMRWQLLPDALAALDVNLAPLEVGDPFCEAKSELKFVEAGAVGVPTVASPTDAFAHAIADGANGFLADTTDRWLAALTRLVDDAALREALGAAARATVVERYATDVRGPELAAAIERLVSGRGGQMADADGAPRPGGAAPAARRVVEDVPGLDRFAMGADLVAAEDAVRHAGPLAARGSWLAARLRADLGVADVAAVPYAVDPARWFPGLPAPARALRVLLDIAPEPPVDPSTTALGLEALALAVHAVPDLQVDLFATRGGAVPPDDPRLAGFGWLGVLDDVRRAAHLRTAAALLVPACGNVRLSTVEAMASGCAVVGCDVPAVRWLLADGATAALAPPQADALAAVLARVLHDGALRARIALGALAAAERQTAGRAAVALGGTAEPSAARWLDRVQPLGGAQGPPLAPGVAVGQSFTARMDGLCRLDVQLAAPLPEGAALRLELLAAPGAAEPLAAAEAHGGPCLDDAWLPLEFAPIAGSAGRRYYAELRAVGGTPGASPPSLCMADAAVFAAGRTYLDGAASDSTALAFRTLCRPTTPAPALVARDPRQPVLDAIRHEAQEAADLGTALVAIAASAPYRLMAWLGRWWAPLPPIHARPWPADAATGTKLRLTLRHFGPVAVAREVVGALRWRWMDEAERQAVLRRG